VDQNLVCFAIVGCRSTFSVLVSVVLCSAGASIPLRSLAQFPPRQRSGDRSPPAGSRDRAPVGFGAKPAETVENL